MNLCAIFNLLKLSVWFLDTNSELFFTFLKIHEEYSTL